MAPALRIVKNIVKATMALNALAILAGLVAKRLVPAEGDETTDEFVHPTVMFGSEFHSRAKRLRRGRIFTFMGGAEIDLTAASIDQGAELEVTTIMGGVEVRVPPTWRLEASNSVMAGDTQMAVEGQDDLGPDAPVLHLRTSTVMGGLVITNRPRRRATPSPV